MKIAQYRYSKWDIASSNNSRNQDRYESQERSVTRTTKWWMYDEYVAKRFSGRKTTK